MRLKPQITNPRVDIAPKSPELCTLGVIGTQRLWWSAIDPATPESDFTVLHFVDGGFMIVTEKTDASR